ncbi:serine hydrolase domain-containing protein [Fulvivirga sedimenti]|uniref:Beta-lactamase family protein n=1 Tax=Fulvivirga sedimenti TaxID=2879465 RepID=A0A9X1HSV0_9BACT|nr:serine hydrolase domain-containing protein [Fulvivirga sedimenti]MCA6075020.1 beta-lactamase family protein [Fulvivirga sedimenti]MCA6076197.1 beta-lactamase family protein [Fulvivirga sedimenti]MCA6077325.1 beta-lactamase family protein [Fulvivirga sedimenti]
MKSNANKLFFQFFLLFFIGSCTSQPNDTSDLIDHVNKPGCILPDESVAGKEQLEQGIRRQVKFSGEPENFSSIPDKMKEYQIPALSLAIIKNGEIEWSDVYENEDFADEQTLDCTSIFQAASLSKPVTVMAAVRMYSAGEIDLDTNIQDYLKDFEIPEGKQRAENPVTFRNIFSHTSGINPGGYQGYNRSLPMPTDMDILRGSEGVNTPAIEVTSTPNETLAYSGGAYTLAEVALQNIFNDEFSTIMKRWILDPAGMNHSEFTQPLPASDSNRVAKGYTFSGDMVEGGWRNHPEQAAAGLWSNSVDLAKFLIEIYKAYNGEVSIFSQSEINSLLNDERNGHVYGFIIDRSGDDISITHYGGNEGYRTGMTISLTSGNGLVYLTNSDNGGTLGNELLLSASQIYDWRHFSQTEVQRKQVDQKILKALPGNYRWNNQIDLSITFDANDGLISLIFPNGDEYELVPIDGDELDFIHPGTGVTVSFSKQDEFHSFILYGQSAKKL